MKNSKINGVSNILMFFNKILERYHGFSSKMIFSRFVNKNYLFFILCGLILAYILHLGCSVPTDFKSPKWDTKFVFPLSDYTYEFIKFIEDSADITDEHGNPVITAPGDTLLISYRMDRPDSLVIEQELAIDPLVKESYRQEIGRISLNLESTERVYFPFQDVKDIEVTETEVPIPSFAFSDTSSTSFGTKQGLYRMLFKEDIQDQTVNNIRFKITNGMPVGISNLVVSLLSLTEFKDFTTGEMMPPLTFISGSYIEDIPRNMALGEEVEILIPLTDKTVPSNIVFKIDGYTTPRGSSEKTTETVSIPSGIDPLTGEIIYSDSTITVPEDTTDWLIIDESVLEAPILIKMELTRMDVEKAEAKIPEQRMSSEYFFDMSNPDMTISSINIAEGGLNFNFTNHLPVNTTILLNLLEFDKEEIINIPGMENNILSEGNRFINFSGYILTFPDTSNQQISYTVEVITHETDHAVISNQDFIDIQVSSDVFKISELTGYLGAKEDIPTMTQELPLGNMPEGIEEGISFLTSIMTVGFHLDIGESNLPLITHIELTGLKEDGRQQSVIIDTTFTETGTYEVPVEAGNLVSLMPDSIRVSGYVAMEKSELATFTTNSDFELGGIADEIWVMMNMPTIFKMSGITVSLFDVEQQEIEEDMREYFEREDVKSVYIVGDIYNYNPLSGEARILISPDSLSFTENPTPSVLAKIDTLLTIGLPQPTFDEFGNIIAKGESKIQTGIDSTKFDLFTNEYLYAKTEVSLDSTNVGDNEGGWVYISPNNYINVKTSLEIDLHIDPENINE